MKNKPIYIVSVFKVDLSITTLEAESMGIVEILISLLWLLYIATALAVVLPIIISLWRSMKAQEAMAASLERIERIIAQNRE